VLQNLSKIAEMSGHGEHHHGDGWGRGMGSLTLVVCRPLHALEAHDLLTSVFLYSRFPGDAEPMEKKECCYTLEGHEFRHLGTMRVNRMQMVENLRFAFPDVKFVHR
jgi:hypothetical protein